MAPDVLQIVEGERIGAEALRDGRRVAHLLARLGEAPSRGRFAWVELADASLDGGESPELLADVYAAAGERWVRLGHLTHLVEVPCLDEVLRVWFALGFGQEQVHAAAPARAAGSEPPPGVSVREATADDLDRAVDVGAELTLHQLGPPVWSGLEPPAREELLAGWREFLAEDGVVVLLAEHGDAVVGIVALEPGGRPEVAHLPLAATSPEHRGRGIGVALAHAALDRAHADGYRTVELDWRSTNLLASRFWPARGFEPTHVRVRRDVQPYA